MFDRYETGFAKPSKLPNPFSRHSMGGIRPDIAERVSRSTTSLIYVFFRYSIDNLLYRNND